MEYARIQQVTTLEIKDVLYPKIKSAEIVDEYTLLVYFSNDKIRKYNVQKLLENPTFSPLKSHGFFKNFQIDSSGSGIVWNDEIDLSEYEIWINGTTD